MNKLTHLGARVLLALIFVLAGAGKIAHFSDTQAYMSSVGVPGMLLPLVILLELGGGLALIVGFKTKWVASALALFCVVSAAIFHHNFADQVQMIMFLKNLAITGGLLLLVQHGASAPSLDTRGK